ncbi:hypothetical protein ALC57_18505 [Trachymyrmex cornetzi]|uniref:HAT C-terminal dimerisation domain-containing protein n=1 Tax=Trachymyrmex cornetzi TaxID=471704 RepID=A0A151IRU6_9HYME|nr:hypothetical protein ALC57_18505 [Trachymyrmex cornetzi]
MDSDNSDGGFVTPKKKRVPTWRKQLFTTSWFQNLVVGWLINICDKYKNLVPNVNDIITEWNKLPYYFFEDEVKNLKEVQIELFWYQISEIKDFNDQYLFANLFSLAKIVLSLPHSNAHIERIFSKCSDIKTKKRNRLSTKTMCSLLRIKMQMENLKVNATNYPLREELFKKYNSSYYYREEVEIPSTSQQDNDILLDSDSDDDHF